MIELLPRTEYAPGQEPVTTYDYIPTDDDLYFMERAVKRGYNSRDSITTPVGAVLVDLDTEESWEGENTEFSEDDIFGHPEVQAVMSAQKEGKVGRDLSRFVLYCVSEPCYGCTYFTVDKPNLGRLYIGALRKDVKFFRHKPPDLDFILRNSRRSFTVVSGLLKVDAQELLQPQNNVHSLVP